MMDELRHFLLVAEHGTFTAAARHAHLSQPALTASIRRLEELMAARLFDRDRRGAVLTRAGEALMPRARAALGAVKEGQRAIAELESLAAGEVRIGAGSTACSHYLPAVVAEFHRRHPRIRFVLREVVPDVAVDLLAEGEIDLAVITDKQGERWYDDPLVLVGRPGVDAKTAPHIAFRPGANNRTLLDRHFPGADVVMELGSLEGILAHARAGVGIALVSRHAAGPDLASGALVELADRRTPVSRTLRIVHRGVERLPPAAAAFRALMLETKPGTRLPARGRRVKRDPT